MKQLFEFLPIIVFFAVFKFKGIYAATVSAIIVTALQVAYSLVRKKKVEPMLWISLALITVFGGFTIILKNEAFIKWKPTVLYWIFAAALASGQYIFKKNFIKEMLKSKITLPDNVWRSMNLSWAAFFAALGGVNLYIARNFSTDTWVNFKLFGLLGCTLAFTLVQSFFLYPYLTEKKSD